MENTNYLNNRIEALEAELRRVNSMKSKLTGNALKINDRLKSAEKEIEILNKANYKSHKKMLKYKWENEMREGKFVSSQKVVSELRKDVEYYKLKAEASREDAEYWANEAAKLEVNCNNCNLS